MDIALFVLSLVAAFGVLVCYAVIVAKMFEHEETIRGTIYLLLMLSCGLGTLLAGPDGLATDMRRHFLPAAVIYLLVLPTCALGALLAWLYGLRKKKEWEIETVVNLMGICILVSILSRLAGVMLARGGG